MTHYRRAKVDIDLEALRHNARIAKKRAGNAKLMTAIKANAYGHGIVAAAEALATVADEFAVASIDDVMRIRQALPAMHTPVTVLSGFYSQDEIALAINHQASLVVYDSVQLDYLSGFASSTSQQEVLDVWVKVDTGMSRLGFSPATFNACIQQLEALTFVNIRGVISHFANADVVDHALNQTQIQAFKQLRQEFHDRSWDWSLANSAAILGLLDTAYDWVRPGIMLYGSSPFAEQTAEELDLKPVMTLSSEVISVRQVAAGESIGYGSLWTAPQDTTVAVVACGYGDGYPRVIQENTPVLLDGHRTVILGRVSMDLIVVDASNISTSVGSQVVFWGKGLSVDEVARSAGTIGYELLCRITERVERQNHHT